MKRLRDREDAAIIERQMRVLKGITEAIQSCKHKLQSNQKECELRNKQLRSEKENVLIHFQRLKERMNKSRGRERVLLTEITRDSRKCMQALKVKLARAEGLLTHAEMCRKLETEQEKVLPFYSDSISPGEIEAARGDAGPAEEVPEKPTHTTYATTFDGRPIEKHGMLQNFWKRFNKVQLDKLAAEKERSNLQEENRRLRAILKQYLDGISVSEPILQQDNTLFVVNGRTNAPIARPFPVGDPRVQNDKPVVIEAATTLQGRAMGAASRA